MDENFTKFNKDILDGIENFINSIQDLLIVGGFQGCGKSEIVNYVLETTNLEDTLIFRHQCFEMSSIDDFLLNFYDTFRRYSMDKKIVLKKSLTENFAQKVSFYFKNIDKKSLIIIENFDIISRNSEIIDFLAHLGKFENVKLILITRAINTDYFENKGLSCNSIEIKPNDYGIFELKVRDSAPMSGNEEIQELYSQTRGYELYLKMTLRYLDTVNISLKEFIEEFKKRDMEFEDFLLSKIVALVPPVYLPFLQNMAAITHSVKIDFVENYKLGDISQVNYLHRKLLISMFSDEIYIKDYLRDYFLNGLSHQSRISNYQNLLSIYETELSKSPRDRLLRLSRDSIRKQIEFIKTKLPNTAPQQVQIHAASVNYAAASSEDKSPWHSKLINLSGNRSKKDKEPWYAKLTTLNRDKIKYQDFNYDTKSSYERAQVEDLDFSANTAGLSQEERQLIEDFRRKKAQREQEPEVLNLIQNANNLENEYNYSKALDCLNEAYDKVKDQNLSGEILIKLARNNAKMNDFAASEKNYLLASKNFEATSNINSLIEAKLELAELYRNLYKLEKSKTTFHEVISYKDKGAKDSIARGFLGMGEVYDMEDNFEKALEFYQKALDTRDFINEDNELTCEIYFKIANLYDDGQDPEKALEYYKNSLEAGEIVAQSGKRPVYLSMCLANTGLIHYDFGETEQAIANFTRALEIDTENNNSDGIYFVSRQLSSIYKDYDPEKAKEYLILALKSANELMDAFKIALSHLELGDYFYNTRENTLALQNFLKARNVLGATISAENEEQISMRINDMKVKMPKEEFEKILKEYEPD